MQTLLIKIEDIIQHLTLVKECTGMFFQPHDSYDAAVTFVDGFLCAVSLGFSDSKDGEPYKLGNIFTDINDWYRMKMKIKQSPQGLRYWVKAKNAELSEAELIQKYFDTVIEYFEEMW